jgi:hypothetical protein
MSAPTAAERQGANPPAVNKAAFAWAMTFFFEQTASPWETFGSAAKWLA